MAQDAKLVFDVIMALCSMVLLHIYFYTFLHTRRGPVRFAGWILFVAAQIIVNSGLEIINPSGNLLLTLVSVTLVAVFCYTGSLWKRLMFPVAFVAIWMVIEALWFFCIGYLSGWEQMSAQANKMNIILTQSFMALVVYGIRSFIKKKGIGNTTGAEGIMPFAVLPLVAIGLAYALYQFAQELGTENKEILIWLIIGAFMLIILNLTLYPSYGKWAEELQMHRNSHLHIRQMELYKKHMKQNDSAVTEICRIKHDIKQELIYLKELALREDKEKLLATVEEMIGEIQTKGRMANWTGNAAVDALMNHLWQECEKRKIPLHTDINIPSDTGIQDRDLSVLLGNAFDNALEASEYAETIQPEIWVEMLYEKECLMLIVKNVYDGKLRQDSSGKLESRKGNNHGMGIQSMVQVTEKYQGYFKVSQEERVFILEAMLRK